MVEVLLMERIKKEENERQTGTRVNIPLANSSVPC